MLREMEELEQEVSMVVARVRTRMIKDSQMNEHAGVRKLWKRMRKKKTTLRIIRATRNGKAGT